MSKVIAQNELKYTNDKRTAYELYTGHRFIPRITNANDVLPSPPIEKNQQKIEPVTKNIENTKTRVNIDSKKKQELSSIPEEISSSEDEKISVSLPKKEIKEEEDMIEDIEMDDDIVSEFLEKKMDDLKDIGSFDHMDIPSNEEPIINIQPVVSYYNQEEFKIKNLSDFFKDVIKNYKYYNEMKNMCIQKLNAKVNNLNLDLAEKKIKSAYLYILAVMIPNFVKSGELEKKIKISSNLSASFEECYIGVIKYWESYMKENNILCEKILKKDILAWKIEKGGIIPAIPGLYFYKCLVSGQTLYPSKSNVYIISIITLQNKIEEHYIAQGEENQENLYVTVADTILKYQNSLVFVASEVLNWKKTKDFYSDEYMFDDMLEEFLNIYKDTILIDLITELILREIAFMNVMNLIDVSNQMKKQKIAKT